MVSPLSYTKDLVDVWARNMTQVLILSTSPAKLRTLVNQGNKHNDVNWQEDGMQAMFTTHLSYGLFSACRFQKDSAEGNESCIRQLNLCPSGQIKSARLGLSSQFRG